MPRGRHNVYIFYVLVMLAVKSSEPSKADDNVVSADMPPEWASRVAAADMLYARGPPPPGYSPSLSNGFIGADTDPGQPQMFMAGVYSGLYNVTPSHGAALPNPLHAMVHAADGGAVESLGAALDLQRGVLLNRTVVIGNVLVQTTKYAHHRARDALVVQFEANATVSVKLRWPGNLTSPDFEHTMVVPPPSSSGPPLSPSCWVGQALLPEIPGGDVREVAMCSSVQAMGLLTDGGGTLQLKQNVPFAFVFVYHSDMDSPGSGGPLHNATMRFKQLSAVSAAELLASHKAGMEDVWRSGIELEGNTTVAAAVNSSLFYLRSSAWQDWPWALTPGGLPTQDYHRHAFWDQETWMLPNLVLLSPGLARALLQYRIDRLNAAIGRAVEYGFEGANWPWESASTGVDCVAAPNLEGRFEHHITGDIAMAMRLFHAATGDDDWLRSAWPSLNESCNFFACRATSTNLPDGGLGDLSGAPGERAGNCGDKRRTDNFTILQVIPPDESAGVVDSSVYTNAIAATTLKYCERVGSRLNMTVPALWITIAENMWLPLNFTIYPEGPVHAEYAGYNGEQINQADVALLQYPLQFPMDADIARRDLDYYTTVTRKDGFFTGDSAYSIAYLRLGDRAAADEQFRLAFLHQDVGGFNVWKERATTGGNLNFLTGAGGWLQNFIMGYAGARLSVEFGLEFASPVLPPDGIRSVKLRGVSYLGSQFDLTYDAHHLCANSVKLEVSSKEHVAQLEAPGLDLIEAGGVRHPVVPTPTCVSVNQTVRFAQHQSL